MKLFPPRVVLALALAPTLYLSATQEMIHNSTRYISTSHSCLVLWRFDHSGFLMSMGSRSIPVLKKRIAEPNLDVGHKVHIAWLLGRMGDHSHFPIFIQALGTPGAPDDQYMAVVRMRDFPLQFRAHLPTILAQAKQPQHNQYWHMLMLEASQRHLSRKKEDLLLDSLWSAMQQAVGGRGLNQQQVRNLQQQFGIAEATPKYLRPPRKAHEK